ncbi:DUF4406 domain-containing protein [Patescibacteria group bacterium]|nr:DUF4406 domain-containing protein [Patescibacteria group bacterium]
MPQHYTTRELQLLKEIDRSEDLLNIAWGILNRIPQPIEIVCGPISTGGKGSIEANMSYLNEWISELQKKGHNVFSQIPFEDPMHKMIKLFKTKGYPNWILNDFYLPIFKSGLIKKFNFIPGWQSSTGACWEYGQAQKIGIEVAFLS